MTTEANSMSRIPDFAELAFEKIAPAKTGGSVEPWLTPEGIPVKPSYNEADIAGLDFLDTWPGIPPYLRGPYPTMYVNQPWTIRQYAGFSTAEDSNAFYRRNLAADRRASRSRSTSPPIAATTPIMSVSPETWAKQVSPSIPSKT